MELTSTNWISIIAIIVPLLVAAAVVIARIWKEQTSQAERIAVLEQNRVTHQSELKELTNALHDLKLALNTGLIRIETKLGLKE